MNNNQAKGLNYDYLAREYARHRQVQPEVLKDLIRTAQLTGRSRILDVGCGTGNYLHALKTALDCECWGVEPSEQMMVKARERNPFAHLAIGKAEQLDFPDETFDFVFSVDVIHHVVDRAKYYREARRVLKKGGKICTVTDSEEIIRRRQPLAVYFPETVAVELQRYPRISELRVLMDESGFVEIAEEIAEYPYSLTDIQSFRDKAFSSLHLISADAFNIGIQRMEKDLQAGPIPCISWYLLLWGTRSD